MIGRLRRRQRQPFLKRRIPGVVFRVSRIFAEVPLTASTNRLVKRGDARESLEKIQGGALGRE